MKPDSPGHPTMAIPEDHVGCFYIDFMSKLSAVRSTRRYLEIGVFTGDLFSRITATTAVGVDPEFKVDKNIAANKTAVVLHQMTSDDFFANPAAVASLGGSPDLVFLDGLHLFEVLLRDFYNTEAIADSNTLIVIHDCLPLNENMAHRDQQTAKDLSVDTPFPDYWTGDVWKLIPILQEHRPDLRIRYIDCPWSGLVCVTNLDPSSNVLRSHYAEIVASYAAIPNTAASIATVYKSIDLTSAAEVVAGFDQNLFFQT
jgi:hypothetical protein